MIRVLTVILILLGSTSVFGQNLTEKLSNVKVLIGEPVTLTYSIETAKNDTINFTPKVDEIEVNGDHRGQLQSAVGKIEITEGFRDTSYILRGKKQWRGTYEVTVWDSGVFIIPGPTVYINGNSFQFNDLRISCDFAKKQQGVDLYDIRETYAEIPPEETLFQRIVNDFWWVILTVVVLIVLIIIFRLRSKARYEPVKIVKAMSLKERTIKAIDALENEKMWEKGMLKQHYIELSYILRSYLTARYDLSLLEKTTFQTKQLLLQQGLNEDTVETIATILSQSDLVKFAKSQPEAIEILKISTLAKQIVAETSPLEFDNYE